MTERYEDVDLTDLFCGPQTSDGIRRPARSSGPATHVAGLISHGLGVVARLDQAGADRGQHRSQRQDKEDRGLNTPSRPMAQAAGLRARMEICPSDHSAANHPTSIRRTRAPNSTTHM